MPLQALMGCHELPQAVEPLSASPIWRVTGIATGTQRPLKKHKEEALPPWFNIAHFGGCIQLHLFNRQASFEGRWAPIACQNRGVHQPCS